MTSSHAGVDAPLASVERRFNAALIDRALAWAILLAAALVAWRFWWSDDVWWPGLALVVAVVATLWLVSALLLGTTGSSVGRAITGIRVMDAESALPIGVRRALLRVVICGFAGLPTGGLGLAVLAWTAIEDPGARRRGSHDRICRTVVLDVRRPSGADEATTTPVDSVGPSPLVNLTALRLAPVGPDVETGRAAAATPEPTPPVPTPDPTLGSEAFSGPGTVLTGGTRTGTSVPPSGSAARWQLTADTGESVVVSGLVLLGRNPEGRAGERVEHLLALRSDDMSLSKTHVAVQVARDGTPVAVDRGSTNGSVLLRQGVSRDLSSGRAVTLLPGDRIRLGDREVVVTKEEAEGPESNNGRSPEWQ